MPLCGTTSVCVALRSAVLSLLELLLRSKAMSLPDWCPRYGVIS
eukprot:COSAG02_NODE_35659_length_465_cov_0.964481_1_plen_43_part_01